PPTHGRSYQHRQTGAERLQRICHGLGPSHRLRPPTHGKLARQRIPRPFDHLRPASQLHRSDPLIAKRQSQRRLPRGRLERVQTLPQKRPKLRTTRAFATEARRARKKTTNSRVEERGRSLVRPLSSTLPV